MFQQMFYKPPCPSALRRESKIDLNYCWTFVRISVRKHCGSWLCKFVSMVAPDH